MCSECISHLLKSCKQEKGQVAISGKTCALYKDVRVLACVATERCNARSWPVFGASKHLPSWLSICPCGGRRATAAKTRADQLYQRLNAAKRLLNYTPSTVNYQQLAGRQARGGATEDKAGDQSYIEQRFHKKDAALLIHHRIKAVLMWKYRVGKKGKFAFWAEVTKNACCKW